MIANKTAQQILKYCALPILAGTVFQLFIGKIDTSFLKYPWGAIIALIYIYILISLYTFSNRWKWVKDFYSPTSSIAFMSMLCITTLIMGLVPQNGSTHGIIGRLGFTAMTQSWLFSICFFFFMSATGLRAIHDLHHIKHQNIFTTILHLSFFVTLLASTISNGDKLRVNATADLGRHVDYGSDKNGTIHYLPFSFILINFDIDEYPPRLHIADNDSMSSKFISIDNNGYKAELEGWSIECLQYIDMAAKMPGETTYKSMKHTGATTAMLIKASSISSGETVEGWVSCGSHIFESSALSLPDVKAIVMPRREVKKYTSRVVVDYKEKVDTIYISVNHPAEIGGWKIYQAGYNSSMGKWSTTSTFECVRDRYSMIIQVALWVILISGISAGIIGRIGKQIKSTKP